MEELLGFIMHVVFGDDSVWVWVIRIANFVVNVVRMVVELRRDQDQRSEKGGDRS